MNLNLNGLIVYKPLFHLDLMIIFTRSFKRKHKTVLSLFDLNILLNSGRHQMLSKLASLSVSSLRKLDDEVNKFYDRKHDLYEAVLLT